MQNRFPIFAANWKMNQQIAGAPRFIEQIRGFVQTEFRSMPGHEIIIFPPATHLSLLAKTIGELPIALGGQNSGPELSGAFTGEISPSHLEELGCRWTLIGHSERRHVFGETDELLFRRIHAALETTLSIMFCVGETLEERKKGQTFFKVFEQLSLLKRFTTAQLDKLFAKTVIAYEPVWAIGTGENATAEQAEEVHLAIRNYFHKDFGGLIAERLRILYGGSVKPENALAIMKKPNIDGLLIGGASLDPISFAQIVQRGLESRL